MAENNTAKKSVVIDSSAVLARLLPDETSSPKISTAFRKFSNNKLTFVAPVLLKYEVGNALKSASKQKRIATDIAQEIYSEFLTLPIKYTQTNYSETLLLATNNNISFYDASYLNLATLQGIPLLTLDTKQKKF